MESWLASEDEDSSNDEWMDAPDQAEAQFDLGEEEDGMDEKKDTKTTEITDSPTHTAIHLQQQLPPPHHWPSSTRHSQGLQAQQIHWEVMPLLLMPFCKFLEGIHVTKLQSRQTCMPSKTHLLMDIIGIQHQQMKSCCSLGW